ncbi:MAG: response regulator transcription factor [Acidobacteriota bacterium]
MIRVLVVDDQNLFREGLITLLSVQDDIEVAGEATDGHEAIEQTRILEPDVVLMDLRMPVLGGAAATREILASSKPPAVLVLTTFDDDEDVFAALQAGAAGYLLKDSPSARLVDAIRTVARGEPFLQSSITAKVLDQLKRRAPASTPPTDVEPLSEREREILTLLAEGLPNKAIGRKLHLAEGTVKNYVTAILGKLGVSDRTQAALKARDLGWV